MAIRLKLRWQRCGKETSCPNALRALNLKKLPVDYLKIDGVFIKDIVKDAIASEMVAAIPGIASVMEIQTIAEFVEDDAILMKLKLLGVD